MLDGVWSFFIWIVGLFILYIVVYLAVKHAIDDSKILREIKNQLLLKPSINSQKVEEIDGKKPDENQDIDGSKERCPACGIVVSESARNCPSCGLTLTDEAREK